MLKLKLTNFPTRIFAYLVLIIYIPREHLEGDREESKEAIIASCPSSVSFNGRSPDLIAALPISSFHRRPVSALPRYCSALDQHPQWKVEEYGSLFASRCTENVSSFTEYVSHLLFL